MPPQGYDARYGVYLMDLAYLLVPLLLAMVSFGLILQFVAKSVGTHTRGQLSIMVRPLWQDQRRRPRCRYLMPPHCRERSCHAPTFLPPADPCLFQPPSYHWEPFPASLLHET